MRDEQPLRRVAHEWRRSRQHLVRHAPPGVEVRVVIHVRIAHDLFRRHVGRRADARSGLGERRVGRECPGRRDRLGDPKVGDDRDAVREEHVVGLDVAVDDAPCVRVAECARHVVQDPDGLAHRERRSLREAGAERLALHEGHRVVGHARGVPSREERDDVRVLQRRRQLDLPLEAFDAHARRDVGGEDLDHDLTVEADLARRKDARHASAAELPLYGVAISQEAGEILEQGRTPLY